MDANQLICAQCDGTRFPEGMLIFYCHCCQRYIHPGCWRAHIKGHSESQPELPAEQLEPRRGKIGSYGIIQWEK